MLLIISGRVDAKRCVVKRSEVIFCFIQRPYNSDTLNILLKILGAFIGSSSINYQK